MKTLENDFVPYVQGVSWSAIKKGYSGLPSIIFQLRLRSIVLKDQDALIVLRQVVDESPMQISTRLPGRYFSPKDFTWVLSEEEGLIFWFRMLEYIEKTEPAALASVLGFPKELQVEIPGIPVKMASASTQKLYEALIKKSPWPKAKWFRIRWQPEISIKMFSKHKLPKLPFYREQTGTTYVLRHGGGLDEDSINVPPSSKPQTYK